MKHPHFIEAAISESTSMFVYIPFKGALYRESWIYVGPAWPDTPTQQEDERAKNEAALDQATLLRRQQNKELLKVPAGRQPSIQTYTCMYMCYIYIHITYIYIGRYIYIYIHTYIYIDTDIYIYVYVYLAVLWFAVRT